MNIFKKNTYDRQGQEGLPHLLHRHYGCSTRPRHFGYGVCRQRPHYRYQQPVYLYLRADPCHWSYPVGLRRCAGRSVPEVPRPLSESQRFPDPCRRRHHHLCKGNPRPDCRLKNFTLRGVPEKSGAPLNSLKGGAFRERQLGRTKP